MQEESRSWYRQLFFIFSCCTKSGDQEGLSKFGYKTNREGKNPGILLHVGEPLEPIS
jgi:hypothetical protein